MPATASPIVLLIARPGRDRSSLAALLKTLDQAELFLLDGAVSEESLSGLSLGARFHSPDLVVVDLDGLNDADPDPLEWAAQTWPKARRLALSDRIHRAPAARPLDADCALARTSSAGDLLSAARRIIF